MNEDATHLPDLKVVVTAGEKCPRNLPDIWVNNGKLFFNAYGPTEVRSTRQQNPLALPLLPFLPLISFSFSYF